MTIIIDENIKLEQTDEKFAPELFQLIDDNRQHLSAFLPWVPRMKNAGDCLSYLQTSASLCRQQAELSFLIFYDEALVGRVGLHHINHQNKNAAIGYWLGRTNTGKGIVTKCCIALLKQAFLVMLLQRIEIKAAVKNIRSQAIPEKLGFKKEGILKKAEFVNNEFIDLVLYAMQREQWEEKPPEPKGFA